MKIKEKLQKFSELCGDWNYRKIDMTIPHIQRIDIEKDNLSIFCELFSADIDDYVSCNGGNFKDKLIIRKFKKLNLDNKEDVLNFISSLNNLIDWNKIDKVLNIEVEKESKYLNVKADYDDRKLELDNEDEFVM